MTSLLPFPELQFLDNDGNPLAAGQISTYVPGTLTPKVTWQDANQITANPNPIILDAAGRCICYGSGTYRFIVSDALGNLVYDQLTSSALSESAISAAMLPVVGAATIATADALLGIPELIQEAVANIELMPGPTGPTGPKGPAGPIGTTGPAGNATGAIRTAVAVEGVNDTNLTITTSGGLIVLNWMIIYGFVNRGMYAAINTYLDGALYSAIPAFAPSGGGGPFTGITYLQPAAGTHNISMHLTDANGLGMEAWVVEIMALYAMEFG